VRIDDLLEEARSGLERLSPADAHAAVQAGAVLVDIRDQAQAALDGAIPGAVGVPRNVLEWRCAPDSAWRDERLSDPARLVIVICDEGYQSSLAAATLKRLGLTRATDVDGGFQAWRAAGLPVKR
jgi:rhodanese-related sulfurtransferase